MPLSSRTFFSFSSASYTRAASARGAHSSVPRVGAAARRGPSRRAGALRWGGGLLALVALGIAYRLAPPTALPFGPQNRLLTAAEVQAHNTPESVWVIIDGSVYDVTAFVPAHPIGPDPILHHAGEDITAVFNKIHKPTTLSLLRLSGKVKAVGVADPVGQRVAGRK